MEKKKEIEVDLESLILRVYNLIANWHNSDDEPEKKQISLKYVSQEIIDTVLSEVTGQIGVNTRVENVHEVPKEKYQDKKKDFIKDFEKKFGPKKTNKK